MTDRLLANSGAPRWEKFVVEVLPDDDLRDFVHRYLGYSLTGITREQKMLFCYGEGNNGKNVLVDTVKSVMGDYAVVAPEKLLTATKQDSHPTELMTLRGRRLAIASETDKGRSWSAARLKRLTGDREVSARGMNENFSEFTITHKFIYISNPKPGADPDDEALHRRLMLVPFVVCHKERDDPDPARKKWPIVDLKLGETLQLELSGILNWMVEGCLAWQKRPLTKLPKMREAEREYRDEQREKDALTSFLGIYRITADGVLLATITAEFNRYVDVELKRSGERMSGAEMRKKLEKRGYDVKRKGRGGYSRVFPSGGPAHEKGGEVVDLSLERKARKY